VTRIDAHRARAQSRRHPGQLFNRLAFRRQRDQSRRDLRVCGFCVEQLFEQLFGFIAVQIFATNETGNEFC
jgi:hypothetical protein